MDIWQIYALVTKTINMFILMTDADDKKSTLMLYSIMVVNEAINQLYRPVNSSIVPWNVWLNFCYRMYWDLWFSLYAYLYTYEE